MKFDELNSLVPYTIGNKVKVLSMNPYPGVVLRMPGRHAEQTDPPGGDFVVEVVPFNNGGQFTHGDIFQDLELKYQYDAARTHEFMGKYLSVVRDGADPDKFDMSDSQNGRLPGVRELVMLYALQCLAVAEYRRYARYENKFGGRYLPFRFGAGIVEGLWTAGDAIEKQKRGRPGVEWLEKDYGQPVLTQELMKL